MKDQQVHLMEHRPGDQDQSMIISNNTEKQNQKRIKNNVKVLKNEIKAFIRCLVEQILKFYCIELKMNDIKKDLVENMVTNMIIKDDIYYILHKLYTELNENDIQILKKIQDDDNVLKAKLNFDILQINKEF